MNAATAARPASWAWALAVLAGLSPGVGLAQGEARSQSGKRPELYDTRADARAQVEAARAQARRDNKRVLVMFGFNACGWCHKLHGLFASDAEIRDLLRSEYALVMVDIEAPHADELLVRCKAALSRDELQRGVGFPFLAVLDADGKVVTAQRTDPLEEGDHHDPKKVKGFLARWVAEPLDAGKVLADALARAASEDKRVLLHFGAPSCGWCHRLDDFLARAEVAEILGREFLDVKVDIDRMKAGKEVMARYRPDPSGGIPWLAILDAKGEVLATSDGPKGNIGYPAEPDEIDHFLAMLKKTSRRIEPARLGRIEGLLKEAAGRIKAQLAR